MKACEQGVRTLFVTATALITTLGKPQLLIIDEIGYLPIDRQGSQPVLSTSVAPL